MKKSTLLLFLALNSSLLFAQLNQGEFAVGGKGLEQGYSIVQSADGGYAITGSTQSFADSISGSIYIVKLDAVGNLKWTRTIDGKKGAVPFSLVALKDGGYAVAGVTSSFADTLSDDMYVVKLDSLGNFKWSRTIGGLYEDRADAIIQSKDGSLVIAGYTDSYGVGYENMYVVKLDTAGNLKWTRTVGGTKYDEAYALAQSKDGGYVLAGSTTSYGDSNYGDVYVVKLDSSGNFKWGRSIGDTTGTDQAAGIAATYDNGCVVTGYTLSYGAGNADVYVIKLDSIGVVKWTRVIGGKNNDYGNAVIESKDKGIVVAGLTASFVDSVYDDAYVIKLDSVGSLEWIKAIGGKEYDYATSIVQTKDNGYAMGGSTTSFSTGYFDFYFIKTDSMGNSCSASIAGGIVTAGGIVNTGGISGSGGSITSKDSGSIGNGGTYIKVCSVLTSASNMLSTENSITVSPNPSSGKFTFQSSVVSHQSLVEVYNVLGEKVYSQLSIFNSQFSIDLENQPSGVYFYRVLSDNKFVGSGKLIIQ